MRDEIVGGAGGRPEPDHRRPPAAVARAMGKRAEICQMRKVARADRTRPGAPFEIARQLRKIRRFHAEAFLRHDGTGIGELAARDTRPALELGEALGIDREREVMAAHHKLARGQLVLCGAKARDLRGCLVAGGDHLTGFERQFRRAHRARQKAPGLRQHQRHRQRQQRIEEPRMRRRHVFAKPEDRTIARAARRADLVGLPPEDRAVGIDAVPERPRHQRHRQIIYGQDQPQRRGNLAEENAALVAQVEPLQIVAVEAARQRRPQILDRNETFGIGRADLFAQARQRLVELPPGRLAARRARRHDHRQIPVVLVEPVLQDAAAIGPIKPGRELIAKGCGGQVARPVGAAQDECRW